MHTIEIIYLVGFVLGTAVRRYFTGKFKPGKEQMKRTAGIDKLLLALIGISMLLPLVKIWVDIFPFANYIGFVYQQWLGLIIFFLGIYLLYQSHRDLGKNWNPQVALNDQQVLVQEGVYRNIRHPMYTAHILWAMGNALVFTNWIVGPAMIIFCILFIPQRIKREEILLIDSFGPEYQRYIEKTGALFPKLMK